MALYLYLPMGGASVNQITLRFRLVLEALRNGRGEVGAVRCVVPVTLLVRFLREAGHGAVNQDILGRAEGGLARTLQ